MASNRYILKQGTPEKQAPGTWWRALHGRVFIRCPECTVTRRPDHAINDEGEVHPSLECPTKGCSFHKYVTLEGWSGD